MKYDEQWIVQQAELLTGETFSGQPLVFEDTSHFMSIERGHIIELEGEPFLVRGNEREGRFGLEEQPKFWVKRAISLASGRKYILKLVFQEAFKVQIGVFQVTCRRSEEKEARVIELVRGDQRFMQGRTVRDSCGNLVRVIDFIEGVDLLNHVCSMEIPHEQYFREYFPSILSRAIKAFMAIQFLKENGSSHGDIRNDHILIERGTGCFRWIDFDLTEDFSDFDLWSLGNILHCVIGKGFVTFRDVIQRHSEFSGRFSGDDASVFFPHRIMNLGKVYPYLPKKLNQVLLRFSAGTQSPFDSISQLVEDLEECSEP